MGDKIKHENETFQADYDKLYAKGSWNKDEISMMKDLKKLIYYNKVICAMDEGKEYPGSEYMPENMSGARGRDGMGRYTSGNVMSGMHQIPPYYYGTGPSYDNWDTSGRRYYDSEKEKAIHKLHEMMSMTDDPERKNVYRIALNELEQK